jgi:predicted ABC-type transport system involved in lysophospholipase L1 biosynthesis ATPase subunit
MRRSRRAGAAADRIEIVGARANNLRDLDLALPLGAVTLVAGVSGSGKSSLLADTLATKANARMRRFLGVPQDHLEDADPEVLRGRGAGVAPLQPGCLSRLATDDGGDVLGSAVGPP